MNSEKEKILDMIDKGTISPQDAARLLEALGETEEKQKEQIHQRALRMKGKSLYVKVNGRDSENKQVNVNVRVPLVLARYADNIISTCVPASVTDDLKREGIDLRNIDIGGIIDVFEELDEDIVNVDVGEGENCMKVRVYVE